MDAQDDNFEGRPSTSLNGKRAPYDLRVSSDKINRGQKQAVLYDSLFHRKSSSSQSQFRAVKMSSSQNTQMQMELGFIGSKRSSIAPYSASSSMVEVSRNPQLLKMSNSISAARSYSRAIPKNIFYDKEQLYDQLLQSKTINNSLSFDNQSLKTKLTGMHEEMMRITKRNGQKETGITTTNALFRGGGELSYKRGFDGKGGDGDGSQMQQQSSIIYSLKDQVSELKMQLQERDALLQKTLRSAKVTSIKELEVQVKLFEEECLRLRRMLDQSMKVSIDASRLSSSEDSSKVGSWVNMLKQDNVEMAATLKRCEEEIFENKVVIETLEKQLRSSKTEQNLLRRDIQLKCREIEGLRDVTWTAASQAKKNPVEGQLRGELEKKCSEVNSLLAQILQKDKRIMDLEKRLREKDADFSDKLGVEVKEKQELQKQLDKERDVTFRLRQDLERSGQEKRFARVDTPMGSGSTAVQIGEFSDMMSPEQRANRGGSRRQTVLRAIQRQPTFVARSVEEEEEENPLMQLNRRRLPKVTKEEAKKVAEVMKFKLKLERFSLLQLEKLLFSEANNEEVSLLQLFSIFSKPPCEMNEKDGALMLSRYLVEDNEEDALRHLLDNYAIFSIEEEAKESLKIAEVRGGVASLNDSSTQALLKQKGSLLDLLQRDPASRRVDGVACCEKKQLIGLLESIEVKLSLSDIEVLFTKLFESSRSLEAIPINSIYRIFDVEKLQAQVNAQVATQVNTQVNVQVNAQVNSQVHSSQQYEPPGGAVRNLHRNSQKEGNQKSTEQLVLLQQQVVQEDKQNFLAESTGNCISEGEVSMSKEETDFPRGGRGRSQPAGASTFSGLAGYSDLEQQRQLQDEQPQQRRRHEELNHSQQSGNQNEVEVSSSRFDRASLSRGSASRVVASTSQFQAQPTNYTQATHSQIAVDEQNDLYRDESENEED